jgi:hypothetical protein
MRRLDRDLAGAFGDVGCEQPLLDQKLDERASLLGNLGKPRHPPAGVAGLGIDSRNERAPQHCELGGAILRRFRTNAGAERAFDRGLDRAFDAAELFIFGELD